MSGALTEATTKARAAAPQDDVARVSWRSLPTVSPLCACRRFLAAEDGRDREQALLTLAGTLVVVEEFEFTLAQLQDCHVGGRTDVERAAVVERREDACGIDRTGCDRRAQRHAEHEELRHDIRHVDYTGGTRHRAPVGRDSIGPELLRGCGFDRLPIGIDRGANADVEYDTGTARLHL